MESTIKIEDFGEYKIDLKKKYFDYKPASALETKLILSSNYSLLRGGTRVYAETWDRIKFVTVAKGKFDQYKEMRINEFLFDKLGILEHTAYPCRAPSLKAVKIWNKKTKDMKDPEEHFEEIINEIMPLIK
jgi:hypothetical protein